jgi:CxxC-x17-CxxC domain-containing protein
MSGSDLLLTCSDCGQEFTFTAGEQQFFQERGYSSPRRCKPCRQAKQGAGGGGGGHTASHAQHDGGYSAGSGAGMSTGTTVVCASCGQTTTVPFEPRGDRPVYCKSCYRPKQGGGGGGGGGRQNRGGSGGGSGGGGGNRDRDRRRY